MIITAKNTVKCLLLFLFLTDSAWAVQKAKIISTEVEIYEEADFDSEIISSVHEGETYLISDKTYGPFYRIKLKNGKIGYIVDYELDIEGKGRIKEKDLDAVLFEQMSGLINDSQNKVTDAAEEAEVFGLGYSGPALQLINFHENVFGADQVDDLLAVGYKNISDMAWSILGSFKVPKYYTDKVGYSAKGMKVWADLGFSSQVVNYRKSSIRFSGTLFTHVSLIQLETTTRKYDLHDITLGLALELGWLIKIKKNAMDLAVKYYFDKTQYAGLGVSFLF